MAATGALLRSIALPDLEPLASEIRDAHITDCELIASFNWLEKTSPSIATPGMPAAWTPLPKPRKLQEDSGIYYRDRNASKCPQHPMEPPVKAILSVAPESVDERKPVGSIDIFGCGSTLGNLLRFVRGCAQPFRALVEVVGSTVHVIRRERSPFETMSDVRGYGHTFPEAYTTWDRSVCSSQSHQRIVKYRFGGLGCLVLFEGDGYLPEKAGRLPSWRVANEGQESEPPGSLGDLTASLRISTSTSKSQEALKVSSAGSLIPQAAVFELKTRSFKRQPNEKEIMAEQLPRLWIRSLSNFILAYHSLGNFRDIKVLDVEDCVRQWELQNQHTLSKFAALLQVIVEAAKKQQDGKLEIVYTKEESALHLRQQTPDIPSLLPQETCARWKKWLEAAAGRGDECQGIEEDDVLQEMPAPKAADYTACDEECDYCGHCQY